jgi:hypothetical protein
MMGISQPSLPRGQRHTGSSECDNLNVLGVNFMWEVKLYFPNVLS